MDRRGFLVIGGSMMVAGPALAATRKIASSARSQPLHEAIARLEKSSGGRLGVAAHDVGSGWRFGWRGKERFAMCSSFKLPLASAVLARVEQGGEQLDRRIPIAATDSIGHAPFTRSRIGQGATVRELCHAMTVLSDNGAANLMLAAIGGPAALTRYLRSIGDSVTRLDRTEPTLNAAIPGDPRDTTSPVAIIDTVQRLVLGTALSPAHRALLASWMVECRTGGNRLRAGLPRSWRAGDKTGTSGKGTYNDVAIAWPPNRKPVLIACYLTECKVPDEAAEAIHAAVARAVVSALP